MPQHVAPVRSTPLAPDPALGRRGLLAAAGLAGGAGLVAGAAPAQAAPRPPGGPARGFSWRDLSFDVVSQQRPRDLVADRFVQLRDTFGPRGAQVEVLAPVAGTPAATPRRRGGRLEVGAGPHATLLRSSTGQVAPYASVVVEVASLSGDTTLDRVDAGLVADARNHVLGWYDGASGTVGIDVTVDGTTTVLGDPVAVARPAGAFTLALSLTSTTVVVFLDTGAGQEPLVQERLDDLVDLRTPAALARYRNGWGVRSGSGTTVLEQVEAGYFGQLGLRDPHLVTRADGTPYLRDGKAYLTFTCAGLAFFETAHWGVWTLDLRTYELEQVANLFFRREGIEAVLGDHAGHLVLDEANGRWIVATSTWGDFRGDNIQVDHTTVSSRRDLLSGVHVLTTTRLALPISALPGATVGQWDPHVVRIGGRWYVGFVNARAFFDFYPCLARSPRGADYTELELLGADPSKVETEGVVLQRIGGTWQVMASNGDASPDEIDGQYPVYDLRMRQVGTLDAPHPTNIPWPMVIPVPTNGGRRTRWILVTFEGTQIREPLLGYGTHGDVLVMQADRRSPGLEFPRSGR